MASHMNLLYGFRTRARGEARPATREPPKFCVRFLPEVREFIKETQEA